MIEEAKVLGAAPELRIDAVKALQQRWQAEAHRVPMDRRHEQKLWDAFRKPIDDAFNRKTAEREKAEQALGARDRMVLDAAKALEAANAIRAAMAALDAALQGQAQAQADVTLGKKPRVWVTQHFAPSATPWNTRSWLSKSSRLRPTERP
jgi:ATP-dependent RNA helicase SUPV3L1/SUV3